MTDSEFELTAHAVRSLTARLLQDRMIGLRLLVDKTDNDDRSAAGLDEAYRVLSQLQSTHAAEVDRLLGAPMTGAWLAHALRRVGFETGESPTPLWADLGYLGWLAVAASIRTGADAGSIRAVVRHGAVMVPGLGMARLAGPDTHCHCDVRWTDSGTVIFATDDTTIRVADLGAEDDPAWLPLRVLRCESSRQEAFVDDLDPFREPVTSFPDPLPRLTADETGLWRKAFVGAWAVLDEQYPHYAEVIREGLHTVVPMSVRPASSGRSTTSKFAYGCVYSTAPMDPCRFAETLIHEFQHSKLTLLVDRTPVCAPDPVPRYFAPWRDDPRPIYGLLHGIHAFTAVADFWRTHRFQDCHRGDDADLEFERWRLLIADAVDEAMNSGLLTSAGIRLVETVAAKVAGWADERVPDHIRAIAADFVFAHRVFWRVRNLRLPANAGMELAQAWLHDSAPPRHLPAAEVVDQRTLPESHRRMFDISELEWLDSDSAEAALQIDPDDPRLWADLALVRHRQGAETQPSMLARRAEVVVGLYRAIGADEGDVRVGDLLKWLS